MERRCACFAPKSAQRFEHAAYNIRHESFNRGDGRVSLRVDALDVGVEPSQVLVRQRQRHADSKGGGLARWQREDAWPLRERPAELGRPASPVDAQGERGPGADVDTPPRHPAPGRDHRPTRRAVLQRSGRAEGAVDADIRNAIRSPRASCIQRDAPDLTALDDGKGALAAGDHPAMRQRDARNACTGGDIECFVVAAFAKRAALGADSRGSPAERVTHRGWNACA